jgi:hypothetical protein
MDRCIKVKFKISEKYNYIDLKVFEEHKFDTPYNRKVSFIFDPNIHEEKIDNISDLDINDLLVAVISNNNYDKYMTENEFVEKSVSNSNLKVPYSLIKFQKPKIINTFGE